MSDSTPPPQPPMPPPGAGLPQGPGPQQNNSFAVTALVMAILQFVCLGPIGSILAIVFGRLGINKAKRGEAGNEGMARVAFWLGIVGLALSVLAIMVFGLLAALGFAFVSNAIDSDNNFRTGLADGSYVMDPNSQIRINERCSFSGAAYSLDTNLASTSDVTVVGEGPIQCGAGDIDRVEFVVSGGVAQIISAS